MDTTAPPHSRAGAFRHRSYRLFWAARFLATFAALIVSVSVGWQVYDLTRNPLDLGFVGLVQFAPALLLVLFSGAASDRFNRRAIFAVEVPELKSLKKCRPTGIERIGIFLPSLVILLEQVEIQAVGEGRMHGINTMS